MKNHGKTSKSRYAHDKEKSQYIIYENADRFFFLKTQYIKMKISFKNESKLIFMNRLSALSVRVWVCGFSNLFSRTHPHICT